MGKLTKLTIFATAATLWAAAAVTPGWAQAYARPQDGFSTQQYSGQYSGQYFGQYSGRVDGRGSHNEGLPPSAADKAGPFTYSINPSDCAEVDAIAPDARRGWQARVRSACQ
jgi:hypothetical protein